MFLLAFPTKLRCQEFQWLEFFAGQANCTYMMRKAGFMSGRFDIDYCSKNKQGNRNSNWHDLLSSSGFVTLNRNLNPPPVEAFDFSRFSPLPLHFHPWPSGKLRLALVFVLKGKARDFIAWFGIKCSSFIGINSGTSKRCKCSSVGNTSAPSVVLSNGLLDRTNQLAFCETFQECN